MPEDAKEVALANIVVRQSIKLLAFKLVVLEVFFAVFLLLLLALIDFLARTTFISPVFQFYSAVFLVLLILLKIGATLIVTFQWAQNYYEFRTDRLVFRSGVFSPMETEYDYAVFKLANIRQDLLGKVLDYGSIVLARPGGGELCLCDIPEPYKHLRLLEKAMAFAPKINIVLKNGKTKKAGPVKESNGELVE